MDSRNYHEDWFLTVNFGGDERKTIEEYLRIISCVSWAGICWAGGGVEVSGSGLHCKRCKRVSLLCGVHILVGFFFSCPFRKLSVE